MNTGELRACGLSERKASYILDLAGRFASDQLSTARISAMDDDMLFAELSAVKGIGVPELSFDSGQGMHPARCCPLALLRRATHAPSQAVCHQGLGVLHLSFETCNGTCS